MEWEALLVDFRDKGKLAELESGQVFEMETVEIKDRQTLERFYARAQICKDKGKLPDGDILWVRGYRDEINPEPFRIKILEKPGNPYDKYY